MGYFLSSAVPSPPEAPLEITDIQKSSASISWNHSLSDGGSPITHYAIERKESWKSSWTFVERIRSNNTTFKLTGLTDKTTYLIRVKAENKIGSSEPLESDEQFTPKSPYSESILLYRVREGFDI